MPRLVPVGRVLYAFGLIGLGIDHFIFQQFITGRPPAWPESVPGGPAVAYLSGVGFILTGIAILTRKGARAALVISAGVILAGAVLRHLPALAESTLLASEWTRAGKSLWLVGGSLLIAATFPVVRNDASSSWRRLFNREREFVAVGRITLGLFQILTGLQHFKFTRFVASLIPGWFPGDAVFWTYFGGVALIAGGIGLLLPRTAPWAALLSGLMILSWFFIVHLSRELAGVADGIAVFEALADAGLLFVLAGVLGRPAGH